MTWQPIETAPRDFASQPSGGVLLWGKPFFERHQDMGAPRCFVGFWSFRRRWEEQMQGMSDVGIATYEVIPTHWMPLPKAPEMDQ